MGEPHLECYEKLIFAYRLMRLEYLYRVKPMVVDFCSIVVDATQGEVYRIWEHLHSFRKVKWGCGVSQRFNLLVLCFV